MVQAHSLLLSFRPIIQVGAGCFHLSQKPDRLGWGFRQLGPFIQSIPWLLFSLHTHLSAAVTLKPYLPLLLWVRRLSFLPSSYSTPYSTPHPYPRCAAGPPYSTALSQPLVLLVVPCLWEGRAHLAHAHLGPLPGLFAAPILL